MGAEQVLRAALGLALAGTAVAAPAIARADDAERLAPPPAPADERVILVDLRPGDPEPLAASRRALADELGRMQGITVVRDPEIDAALVGGAVDRDAARVADALADARTAFGALDCARASAAADRAIDDLAARQAAGLDDGPALRTAYSYILLCADRAADADAALLAATRLRRLGVTSGDDIGVSAATWAKLPEIDTTGADIVALTVEADRPDAAVWIDHAPVGAAPVTVHLPAGRHVIAAGAGGARDATRLAIGGRAQTVTLALSDQRGPWSEIAGMIKAWRDGVTEASAAGLAGILTTAKVRFAIVLAGAKSAEVWAMNRDQRRPRKLDTASVDQPLELAAIISDRIATWDGRAPDPDAELLVETPEERARRYGGGDRRWKPTKWYVYASLAGAILVGAAVIYAKDSATDTQRIVIQGP
jgi:hypothetical protein